MNIKNLTPHEIVLVYDNTERRFPPSGLVARLEEKTTSLPGLWEVPLCKKEYCTANLPPQEPGTIYLVSAMILAASDRPDLVAPDTGDGAIRNEKGQVVGTTRFVTKHDCPAC